MQHLGTTARWGTVEAFYVTYAREAQPAKQKKQVLHRREQKLMQGIVFAIVLQDGP
jgi:hypothetical protein